MKKILLIIFCSTFLFCASSAHAIFIKTTLAITSVTVPARAEAMGLAKNTEMKIYDAQVYYEIDESDGTFITAVPIGSYSSGYALYQGLVNDTGNNLVFSGAAGSTYNARIVITPLPNPISSGYTYVYPSASCIDKISAVGPVTAYFIQVSQNSGSGAICPNTLCSGSCYSDGNDIYVNSTGSSIYFDIGTISV